MPFPCTVVVDMLFREEVETHMAEVELLVVVKVAASETTVVVAVEADEIFVKDDATGPASLLLSRLAESVLRLIVVFIVNGGAVSVVVDLHVVVVDEVGTDEERILEVTLELVN